MICQSSLILNIIRVTDDLDEGGDGECVECYPYKQYSVSYSH